MNKLNSYMVFINILNFMRNKDTHTRITDKCRCLFVVAYSAMSITGLSSVLAVENHALSSPVSDRVESVQQKKHVSGNVQDANGMPLIGRRNSRIFCELRSQKTPGGILPSE